jgi:hypothetical protein
MKKNFFKGICSLILSALLFAGCQKEIQEKEETLNVDEQSLQANRDKDDDNNGCRLRSLVTDYGYAESFSYNRKGLADIWLIDYGGGDYYEHQITYDKKNKIKGTHVIAPVFLPGDAINYTFYSKGNFTTRALGFLESGPIWADYNYSYNKKGQMISLDETVNDIHTRYYYDNKGYCRRSDYYIGTELFLTLLMDFEISNKNPYLAINGVDFGFPFEIFNVFDKRWNSFGSWIMYDNGNPIVVNEDDPAQTVIHTGQGNYTTYAKYFDIPSASFYEMTFNYSNCNGGDDEETSKVMPAISVKQNRPMPLLASLKKILGTHSKNMKQELTDIKKQILSQRKQ